MVAMKLMKADKKLLAEHYAEHVNRPFFPALSSFMASGPILAMVWEGKDVVKQCRAMLGATNPLDSAPGTIRGDFAIDLGRNVVHGSDSVESANREIALWFKMYEIMQWSVATDSWIYE